jgi:hypothetical protein
VWQVGQWPSSPANGCRGPLWAGLNQSVPVGTPHLLGLMGFGHKVSGVPAMRQFELKKRTSGKQ